jgi:hypothetical protein
MSCNRFGFAGPAPVRHGRNLALALVALIGVVLVLLTFQLTGQPETIDMDELITAYQDGNDFKIKEMSRKIGVTVEDLIYAAEMELDYHESIRRTKEDLGCEPDAPLETCGGWE